MPLQRSIFSAFSASSAPLRFNFLQQLQQRQTQIARRWHSPSHPLQMRHFSGISRANRRHKMSIQHLAPSNPPVISAENMHNVRILRNMRIKNESVPTLISALSVFLCTLRVCAKPPRGTAVQSIDLLLECWETSRLWDRLQHFINHIRSALGVQPHHARLHFRTADHRQ